MLRATGPSLFLGRFWREFRISSTCQKPVSKTYRPTNDNFCLLMTLRFPFWYLILRMRAYTWQRFHFRGKKCPKMCLKINRSVKTPWVMGSWPRSSPPFVWLFVRTWIRKNTDCCRSLLKSYYSDLFFYKDPQVGLCQKAKKKKKNRKQDCKILKARN